MKRYILIFLLCLLIPLWAYALIPPGHSGGDDAGVVATCDTDVDDDCSVSGNWTQDACTWTIGGTASPDDQDTPCLLTHTTQLTSITHWAKVELDAISQPNDEAGVILRSINNINEPFYAVFFSENDDVVQWVEVDMDAGSAEVEADTLAMSPGDYLAVSIEGTGNDTIVKVWKNPSGACPQNWGAADLTFTDNPATYIADTGKYVGIYAAEDDNSIALDNFAAGDWGF